ncbi:MAG: molecular chaperone [Comamonadaceae bacterium]|nr:MAG: molecular chaperone [Comamonadaceae bacterium]
MPGPASMNLTSVLAAACVALASLPASAGEFAVSPVRMEFTGAARSQLLSVTNAGDTPARFLVRGAGWTMSEEGAVQLSEDDALVVFPASFTLAPKASQNIRVGTAQRPAEIERTWRVVLEELPDATAAARSGATINVLSMISVPVFMPPAAPRKDMQLAWAGATGGKANITLANGGNAHELVGAVTVAAMQGGTTLPAARVEGWYVLPGKRRAFTLEQATPWCAPGVTGFELVAADVNGQALARRTVDAAEACR